MTIHAALRIKRQLVANVDKHQTATDAFGNEYNVDRAYTLVLHREFQFHELLDKKGYRYKPGTKKELFVPDTNVDDLIRVLRTIKGEQLYLFNENDYEIDKTYKGGKERATKIVETKRRQTQDRAKKGIRLPEIKLKLSKKAILELQDMKPEAFALLASFIQDALKPDPVITLPRQTIQQLTQPSPPPTAIQQVVRQIPRRSARIAKANPRRSARLNSR